MKTHRAHLVIRIPLHVSVPDDATPRQIRDALDRATAEAMRGPLGEPVCEWDDGAPIPSMRVPEDAWFHFDGHDWCTDGQHMVRRGTPHRLLVERWGGWIPRDEWGSEDDVRSAFATTCHVHGVAYFCRSFLPVLRAGNLVRLGGPLNAVRVEVDGEPVAVVMPVRVDPGEDASRLLQVLEDGTLVVPDVHKIGLGGWR